MVASGFWEKWQFPMCIGVLDGKHIVTTAPPRSGSLFFNYKGSFSIVLLALVDVNYRFLVTQIGDFDRTSDGGVFKNSSLHRWLESNNLHGPPATPLPVPREGTACHNGWHNISPKAISSKTLWRTKPLQSQSHIQLQAVKGSHDSGEGFWYADLL